MSADTRSRAEPSRIAQHRESLWSRPELPALLIIALAAAWRMFGTVDSDVSWQLWIAGRIASGAHLYRDIIETNPPLWFWMAVPLDRLAAALGVRADAVLVDAMAVLSMLSVIAAARLLTPIRPLPRAILLAYAGIILFALPWLHVGQREHLALLAAFPYALLIAARSEGRPVTNSLALVIGLGAALAFALKHYFLLVPALLEVWLIATRRREWRLLRPEILCMIAVGAAYGAALLVFARDYMMHILPLLRLAYGATGARGWSDLLTLQLAAALLPILLIAAHPRLARRQPPATALLIAASAFAVAYFLQFKGWPYHVIPITGCASLALACLLAATVEPPRLVRLLAPPLLVLPLLLSARESLMEPMPTPELKQAVSGLRPGETVGFISYETAVPWAVTLQHAFRYPSRYNGFWMLPAIVGNEAKARPDPRLVELGRAVVRQTVADFRCMPPRRIIVTRPPPARANEGLFDILDFFMRDPQFAELMSHYRPVSRTNLEVYELTVPFAPPPQSRCRRGV